MEAVSMRTDPYDMAVRCPVSTSSRRPTMIHAALWHGCTSFLLCYVFSKRKHRPVSRHPHRPEDLVSFEKPAMHVDNMIPAKNAQSYKHRQTCRSCGPYTHNNGRSQHRCATFLMCLVPQNAHAKAGGYSMPMHKSHRLSLIHILFKFREKRPLFQATADRPKLPRWTMARDKRPLE